METPTLTRSVVYKPLGNIIANTLQDRNSVQVPLSGLSSNLINPDSDDECYTLLTYRLTGAKNEKQNVS